MTMTPKVRRLVWLNGVLLAALAVVTVGQRAGAQPGGSGGASGGSRVGGAASPADRPRGDYTLVTGRMQGGTAGAIYIFDAANQELLALSWDRTHDRFNIIGHRSVTSDARTRQPQR